MVSRPWELNAMGVLDTHLHKPSPENGRLPEGSRKLLPAVSTTSLPFPPRDKREDVYLQTTFSQSGQLSEMPSPSLLPDHQTHREPRTLPPQPCPKLCFASISLFTPDSLDYFLNTACSSLIPKGYFIRQPITIPWLRVP